MRVFYFCAGRGNRTLVCSLGTRHSTTEPYPQLTTSLSKKLSIAIIYIRMETQREFRSLHDQYPKLFASLTCAPEGISVTDIFLVKNSATPPRAVALRLSNPSGCEQFTTLIVHPEGFEPPTTVPKTVVISISLRVQN